MTPHKFDPLVKAKLAILLNSCILNLLPPGAFPLAVRPHIKGKERVRIFATHAA